MDVKIGFKTYGPDATEEKKRKQNSYYKGSKTLYWIFSQNISKEHDLKRKLFCLCKYKTFSGTN